MKKVSFIFLGMLAMAAVSCNKSVCTECHYDKDGEEVELGEYCDEDIERLENEGHTEGSVTYEVHCGEH